MYAMIRFLFLLSLLSLAACVEQETIEPVFVVEDAHSSGSLVAVDAAGTPLAASAGLEGTLALWNLERGTRPVAWKGHRGTVNGLALSSRKGRVISASWDGTLAAWDLQGRLIQRVEAGAPVTAMAASGDLSDVWTGHEDGTLRRWNGELELQQQKRLPGGKRVTALAMSGKRLAAADHGGGLWLYPDPVTRNPESLASLPAYLRSLVFRPGGRELYGGSWFHLYRWNLESGEMRRMRTPHHGIIAGLAWSPSRDELVSISRQTDSSVLSLDPETGSLKDNFGKHDLCGASIAVTGDGRYLITTSDDASVRIWHLAPHEKGLPRGEAR